MVCIKDAFKNQTYAQYTQTWQTYFTELRSLDKAKNSFMKNNCFDIECIYFQLDLARKGFFTRSDLKVFMMQNGVKLQPAHDKQFDLLMNYFDRRQCGRVSFEEFTDLFV